MKSWKCVIVIQCISVSGLAMAISKHFNGSPFLKRLFGDFKYCKVMKNLKIIVGDDAMRGLHFISVSFLLLTNTMIKFGS